MSTDLAAEMDFFAMAPEGEFLRRAGIKDKIKGFVRIISRPGEMIRG